MTRVFKQTFKNTKFIYLQKIKINVLELKDNKKKLQLIYLR
jgi:hypothetical protein